MLSSKEVHWFYDIGYKHDNFEHCPTEPGWLVHGKCYCDPKTSFGKNHHISSSSLLLLFGTLIPCINPNYHISNHTKITLYLSRLC